MPKSRVYKCTACARSHERPTGKHCQWLQLEQTDEPAPQESDNGVAQALQILQTQMAAMQRDMQAMGSERAGETQREAAGEPSERRQEGAEAPSAGDREIPSVRELRRNYCVEREVSRRLAELDVDDDTLEPPRQGARRARGKRSGAARTVQDKVVRDIDWPHFHIYTQPGAEPMTYERLSVQEFAYGYMQMIDQPDADFDRQVMWDIFKMLMEDATEYPWVNVRNFFSVVGSNVENDRMEWADSESIAKLRVKHSQKHEIVQATAAATTPASEKLRYCGQYQRGACPEKGDHGGLKHMCAFCYKMKATPYPHAEADCRRKSGEQPKNARGGE